MFRCTGALLMPLILAATAGAEPKTVQPDRNWVAVLHDDTLKKMSPKTGLVTEKKAFEQLWKAWRKDEKVPEIDFKKQFVVVTLAGGPNKPGVTATLDEGNLKIQARQTLIGGKGFGYSIAVFKREGVKKVNGQELK